jgi:hypothetical protein
VEAEPIAVCQDFEHGATQDVGLALRCSDCGSAYFSPVPTPANRLPLSSPAHPLTEAAQPLARLARGLDPACVLDLRGQSVDPTDLARLPRRHYELVILGGCLEYVHAPLALLEDVREVLRPGGRLALVLNNLASPSFTVFGGRHWAGYDFPRQRATYSVEALHRLAERAGLEVSSISSVANAACWVESCRRALIDWRGPEWLIRRFTKGSGATSAVFAILEQTLCWRGRGGRLVLSLSLPRVRAEAQSPAADRKRLAT